MIRTVRAFFLGCQLREKLLVVVFLAIGVLIWLSNFSRRATLFWHDQRRTTADLADQAQWISHSAEIDALAQKAAARFDASRTLDGTRLLEAVQKIAADLGLRNTTSGGLTNPPGNGQFALHTLDYNVRLADPDAQKNWDALKAFYGALQKRSPYIGIEQFTLAPEANKAQLRLLVKVSSVEVTKTR
jgi:hypothetical protein